MRSLRSRSLQLEIMCQMHTNEIQPISFLHKEGPTGGGAEAEAAAKERSRLDKERAEEARKERGEMGSRGQSRGSGGRPQTAGGLGRGSEGGAWVIPGAPPDLLVLQNPPPFSPVEKRGASRGGARPQTAGTGRSPRRKQLDKGNAKGAGAKVDAAKAYLVSGSSSVVAARPKTPGAAGTNNEQSAAQFVPDAEYHAQLVRLQSLITKKQRVKREKMEQEDRRSKVDGEKEVREGQLEGRRNRRNPKLSLVEEMKVLKYKNDLERERNARAEYKEDLMLERRDKVWEKRDAATRLAEKIRRDKEAVSMNAAMKVMTDKMVLNANLFKEQSKKEQEMEQLAAENAKKKLHEEIKIQRAGGGGEKSFGLKLNMMNRASSKLGREVRRKKRQSDISRTVKDRKMKRAGEREGAMRGVMAKHEQVREEAKRDKEVMREELIVREIVERENMIKKKILYSSGGSSAVGSGKMQGSEGGGSAELWGGAAGTSIGGDTIESAAAAAAAAEVKTPRATDPNLPQGHARTASDAMMGIGGMDSPDENFIWAL
jgi:hypothetical protein